MRVVEPNEPCTIRRVKGDGIIQTVWPLVALFGTFEYKIEPVSTIERMDATVVAQQVLQPVIVFAVPFHILS